jgi:TonB family protein
LDPPDASGDEWALITWTSQSGNPVAGTEEPGATGLEHRSPEEAIRTLSALLAEQSERISALEEIVADLRREVLSLSEGGRATAGSELPSFPTFTPYTVSPEVKNPNEVRRVLREEQQPLVAAGIGGTVRVWFLIDEEGEVQRAHIIESSGYSMLDAAAMKVADIIRFTPALNRDKPVSVWISYPITFTVR